MIKPLTSLRFIFACMVFAAHCYVIDPHFSHFLYKEGFVGVSFFFVLSGFIIAYNYQWRFQENTVSTRAFWIARFGRVYPLHLATLLLSLLTGGIFVSDECRYGASVLLTAFPVTSICSENGLFFLI